MSSNDVLDRADIKDIVERFYQTMLKDPIVGYLFTDIARIDLDHHLPIVTDFWADILFKERSYKGNPLAKHQDLHKKVPLRPGHFTRWLYLFNQAVDARHCGKNASLMKKTAEGIAKTIAASLVSGKRKDLNGVLD